MIHPIWLAAFMVCILMGFGHFFPWPTWLRGNVINRFFCYSYGVGWVLAASALVAVLSHRNYIVLLEVFILFGVAGVTTAACYAYDHYRDVNNRGQRRERVNGPH